MLSIYQKTTEKKMVVETPTRKRPFNSLSPTDQKNSYEEIRREKINMHKRYDRLVEKFESKRIAINLTENSIPKMQVTTACFYLKQNWDDSKKMIMSMILDIQNDRGNGNLITDGERCKLVSYLTESIENLSRQVNGKSNRCRYSSHAVNLAMSLFLKSKSSYQLLRNEKLLSLPSAEVLKKKMSLLKSSPGLDIKSFLFMKDIVERHAGKIKGHLMMDEIKLKNGIMWNCMNGEVTGFIGDELNAKDLMLDILGLSANNKVDNRQLSAYANQWRFRSTRGITHNSCYYFNKGSLTANDIAQQFMDVLTVYENVGVEIYGLVCDGGGSNESFLHSIVENFDLDVDLPKEDSLSFINPLDIKRRIYIWSCGTHSQKALRNNLYRSRKGGTRNLKISSVTFGWKQLQAIYERDEQRSKRQEYRRTDVVQQTINLDSFTMMNAIYAKQPFTSKTISEVFNHISTMFNVKLPYNNEYQSE